MRVLPVLILLLGVYAWAEEPQTQDAAQIAAWVKQLGSEEYAERRAAFEKLKTAGEAAVAKLTSAAQTSDDLEIRASAKALLPYAQGARNCRIWKMEMKERWIAGLKEGRIAGPTLGWSPELDMQIIKVTSPAMESGSEAFRGWLARNQDLDGHWDAVQFGAGYGADVEQTALALLSFLGCGHTEKVGRYREAVRNAVQWLKSRQRDDGAILNAGWQEVDGLTHAIAGLALAEAASMGRRADTMAAAQKALAYSINLHQTGEFSDRSGFGRLPRSETPDLFTTAFFTLQLKSAKVAGMHVDPAGFDGILRFLDSVDAKNAKDGGFFSYVPGGKGTPEATLMGCLARQLLGMRKEDLAAQVAAATKAFGAPSTGHGESDIISNYFGTLATFHQGGELWKTWNDSMKKSLLEQQRHGSTHDGSWEASGKWSGAGSVFATAMNALCLEVYYRYLPLYNR